ncbi:MAG: FHA domain-containing protein [Clostridiales Family XIII bacterium]|jgi:hypothetical protein|nr:FHA domain-containing protein [Clostridiales Family XIII bacterium]
MNLVRCENGHFYDSDLYAACPHCGVQSRNDDVTVALTQGVTQDSVTQAQVSAGSLSDAVQQATAGKSEAGNDSATVGYYDKTLGIEPVVGWLVCVEGNNIGADYRLKSGRNFIGRAASMDVAITGDETVSRDRHAIIVYEPKTHIFLVQAGESKELCYLNEKVVLATDEVKINDILTVGATKLMFFPCCSDTFNWEMVKKEGEE